IDASTVPDRDVALSVWSTTSPSENPAFVQKWFGNGILRAYIDWDGVFKVYGQLTTPLITFGDTSNINDDVNLYRNSTNTLITDDAFICDTLNVGALLPSTANVDVKGLSNTSGHIGLSLRSGNTFSSTLSNQITFGHAGT